MSNILENIVNRNKKINFDFTKSLNQTLSENLNYDSVPVPIEPKESSWETIQDQNRTYMIKNYKFKNYKHLIYFVTEALEYGHHKNHHPDLNLNKADVSIVLYTHDLNDVTESDIDFSKFVDDLYEEINYINEL